VRARWECSSDFRRELSVAPCRITKSVRSIVQSARLTTTLHPLDPIGQSETPAGGMPGFRVGDSFWGDKSPALSGNLVSRTLRRIDSGQPSVSFTPSLASTGCRREPVTKPMRDVLIEPANGHQIPRTLSLDEPSASALRARRACSGGSRKTRCPSLCVAISLRW
jgi:hypothetical protein